MEFVLDDMKKSLKNKKSAFDTQLEHRITLENGDIRHMAVRIKVIISTEKIYAIFQTMLRLTPIPFVFAQVTASW